MTFTSLNVASRLLLRGQHRLQIGEWIEGGGWHDIATIARSTASVFHRPQAESLAITPELQMCYVLPSMRDIDIGFAGRHAHESPVHRHLEALESGSPLQLHNDGQRWVLQDQYGQTVGHMARAFSPPLRMKCVSAHVMAIQVRRLQDTEEGFQHLVKSDLWEVVLPELVFTPDMLI